MCGVGVVPLFSWLKSDLEMVVSAGDINDLINALHFKNASDVRSNAMDALARIGKERAVDAFVVALNDRDSNVREHAANTLWNNLCCSSCWLFDCRP
jgi:hypothetical protein